MFFALMKRDKIVWNQRADFASAKDMMMCVPDDLSYTGCMVTAEFCEDEELHAKRVEFLKDVARLLARCRVDYSLATVLKGEGTFHSVDGDIGCLKRLTKLDAVYLDRDQLAAIGGENLQKFLDAQIDLGAKLVVCDTKGMTPPKEEKSQKSKISPKTDTNEIKIPPPPQKKEDTTENKKSPIWIDQKRQKELDKRALKNMRKKK